MTLLLRVCQTVQYVSTNNVTADCCLEVDNASDGDRTNLTVVRRLGQRRVIRKMSIASVPMLIVKKRAT
jgi:hypothetical protein